MSKIDLKNPKKAKKWLKNSQKSLKIEKIIQKKVREKTAVLAFLMRGSEKGSEFSENLQINGFYEIFHHPNFDHQKNEKMIKKRYF